jgi:hypothetical protein
MNDFERKLSQQSFRAPPLDLRRAILGAPAQVITVPRGSWRDWFWPSPQAWGALAALWLLFAVVQFSDRPVSKPTRSSVVFAPEFHPTPTLLTFHNTREAHYVLDLSH